MQDTLKKVNCSAKKYRDATLLATNSVTNDGLTCIVNKVYILLIIINAFLISMGQFIQQNHLSSTLKPIT